jgi:hypothetical protein
MRPCAVFNNKFTPFLLAPLLSAPVAAATWFVMSAGGATAAASKLASVGAFVLFASVVTLYIVRCMNRYPSNGQRMP